MSVFGVDGAKFQRLSVAKVESGGRPKCADTSKMGGLDKPVVSRKISAHSSYESEWRLDKSNL
jgi:hypothetical protein